MEWVASLGFREPGDPLSNPHRLESVPRLPGALLHEDPDLVHDVAAGPVAGVDDGQPLRTTGEAARRWRDGSALPQVSFFCIHRRTGPSLDRPSG